MAMGPLTAALSHRGGLQLADIRQKSRDRNMVGLDAALSAKFIVDLAGYVVV